MPRPRLSILLSAALGLALGLIAHHLQSPHLTMMNHWGIVAFTSMGASLGCLLCESPGGPM
ncbi:MAG TPA: hypothetical protein VG826_05180 [Pirellulales bacterium]|nr:hypothetical protein [Pirellulales bacterium]